MYGILAQESNWNQASWHALAGYGGNPLVANYYGSTDPANPTDINYDNADCGYGVGQLTDIMRLGTPGISLATQVAVGTDYAENVAAAVQALITKWNQLASLGITMNNDDPSLLENWYAAIWAYNSGVHMGSGGSGLGWLNNPANPIYPVSRPPFLRTAYDDAKHPQDWPYQEKVFGWMENAQTDPNVPGGFRFAGTSLNLKVPGFATFCSLSVNSCDPSAIGQSDPSGPHGQRDPCPSESSSCWWHVAVGWVDCTAAQACSGTTFANSSPVPEPARTDRSGSCSSGSGLPNGRFPAGTIVVDDTSVAAQNPQRLDPNVIGCPTTPSGWSSGGTVQLDDASGRPIGAGDVAAIDLHQLGVGFGGHAWFTHTTASGPEVVARWTPSLGAPGLYQIFAFVPESGAQTTNATYEVHDGRGGGDYHEAIDQNSYSNQWVSVGRYLLRPGAWVQMANVTPRTDPSLGSDIAFSALALVPAAPDDTVAIDQSTAYPFEGWGASLGWWANLAGGWTQNRSAIENDLFVPAGSPAAIRLGLNVLRYNVGASPGGTNPYPSGCPALRQGAQVPTPQQQLGGPISLGVDQNQIRILKDADALLRANRQVSHYEAFANSPPYWMTLNRCPTGSGATGVDVLSASDPNRSFAAYASYLTQVVQHFHTDLSPAVNFDTVEPFNEPSSFPWPGSCSSGCQEGANFTSGGQDMVIQHLCTDLQNLRTSGVLTAVSAPDGNSPDETIGDQARWSSISQGCISQLNTHTYSGQAPYTGLNRPALASVASSGGKNLWVSEYGNGGDATGMDTAITLSTQVARDIQYLRAQAWVYWQPVEAPGDWGLLEAPGFPNDSAVTPTRRFWALAQYSQFIRPNFSILAAHDSQDSQQNTLSVVAEDPATSTVYIVTTNAGQTNRVLSYDLSGMGFLPGTVHVYRTSDAGNVLQAPDVTGSGSAFEDAQPARSITTYVVNRAGAASVRRQAAAPGAAGRTAVPTPGPAAASDWHPLTQTVELDGRAISLNSYCVRSPQRTCQDGLGREASFGVTCNIPGPVGQPAILLTLRYPEQFQVGPGGVVWLRGRSDTPDALGGVTDLRSDAGATVDVVVDGHRLAGTIRCGPQ
jgi:O-glycosyl hydrolase